MHNKNINRVLGNSTEPRFDIPGFNEFCQFMATTTNKVVLADNEHGFRDDNETKLNVLVITDGAETWQLRAVPGTNQVPLINFNKLSM